MYFIKPLVLCFTYFIMLSCTELLCVDPQETATYMQRYKVDKNNYIFSITIPKCGTHMVLKALSLLHMPNIRFYFNHGRNYKDLLWQAITDYHQTKPHYNKGPYHTASAGNWPLPLLKQIQKNKSNNRLFTDHWPYTPEAKSIFAHCNAKCILTIRDPRDMLISMAYYVHKGPDNMSVPIQDLIFDFIDGRQKSFVPWGIVINHLYPLLYELGVTEFYKLFTPWMTNPQFMTVKFESLIGVQGGGSSDLQIATLNQILHHLGLKVTDDQKTYVIQNLFGTSTTFREGKIGAWKHTFTQEMKTAYKKVPGACQLLIDLGYETDSDW